jgi:hypothetical protein
VRRRQALLGTAVVAALVPGAAFGNAPSLERATIPAASVTLSIPAGWTYSRPSPELGAEHVVAVYGAPTAKAGFRANLNVIRTVAPPGMTLRRWLLGGQIRHYLSLGTLKSIRNGDVAGLEYTSSRLESVGGRPLLSVECGFLHDGAGYLFTWSALATHGRAAAAAQALFDASAASIRFGGPAS